MGLFDFIRNQFIEVIEWTDSMPNQMVYRFPVENKEIKMGAQLTVRESQMAVFVNEGQIADIFGPGRYQLSTENLPVITKLKSWKYGFDSPFKAEVYFVNTTQFTDQKWGTANPVMMRDTEFGMLRVRAYGIYAFKVVDPAKFLSEAFGTSAFYYADQISTHLKKVIVSSLSDLLAESGIAAIDFSRFYDELGTQGLEKLQVKFSSFGLKICNFVIENISVPEEVEKALDKRTSMGVLGNLDTYMKFQAAEAIEDAANNQSGSMAGIGAGMGAGAAIGNAMTSAMANQQKGGVSSTSQQKVMVKCGKCGALVNEGAKFCSECGNTMVVNKVACVGCGVEIRENSKFCPECGASQEKKKCANCSAEVGPGAKFCLECGTKL